MSNSTEAAGNYGAACEAIWSEAKARENALLNEYEEINERLGTPIELPGDAERFVELYHQLKRVA